MRTWGGYFCDQVGASPPDWVPDVPVYLSTVSDQRQTVFVGEPDPQDVGRRNPSFSDIRHYYANHMLHVRYFGMLEPALYAYSEGIFGVPFALHWHLHALAWGIAMASWRGGPRTAASDQARAFLRHVR